MMIPMPEGALLFRTGTACDMLIGPCACGATHTPEQIAREVIERKQMTDETDQYQMVRLKVAKCEHGILVLEDCDDCGRGS